MSMENPAEMTPEEKLDAAASAPPAPVHVPAPAPQGADVPQRPAIVCLCGSGRFRDAFEQAEFDETLAGKIVLTIGCNTKDIARTPDLEHHKPMLDALHFRKIDLADEVFILNVGGYIGESTKREEAYAKSLNKAIRYLEPAACDEVRRLREIINEHGQDMAQLRDQCERALEAKNDEIAAIVARHAPQPVVTQEDIDAMRPFRNFIESKWTKRCDDAKRIPDVINDELPKILAAHRTAAVARREAEIVALLKQLANMHQETALRAKKNEHWSTEDREWFAGQVLESIVVKIQNGGGDK